jgi:murein L,D-transpeptidase YafK
MKRIVLSLVLIIIGGLTFANWPPRALPAGVTADRIVVRKEARELTLFCNGAPLKTYEVSLGEEPAGPKRREGDNRTPEGVYTIDRHKADSDFHLALHVSYPNAQDRARALQMGVPPGGDIMIHGLPNRLGWLGRFQRLVDWTAGCIAVTNPEIDEIYRATPDGTPIEIR